MRRGSVTPGRDEACDAWGPVPGRLAQKSVQACEAGRWTMLSFQSAGEGIGAGPVRAVPFRCRSWRCRRCAWQVARDDYRRVELATLSRSWWLYVVLTFDPGSWSSRWDAYMGASQLWDKRLRRRLEREHGRLEYLQTWERTRRAWPHVNLLMRSDRLEEHVRALPSQRRVLAAEGDKGRGRLAHWTAYRRKLARLAPACGFGPRVWVEIVDSREAVAAYLTKVAEEFSRSAFKVGDQRPLGAPPHFRRLRASRGLLPERSRPVWIEHVERDTGLVTGELRARPLSARSTWTAVLAPVPPETFEGREPTWIDVADARMFQARAARRRRGPLADPTFEV